MCSLSPYISRLFLYPIKSLNRLNCDRVTILPSGALQGDRAWAIVDQSGNFVNGKRNPKIHSLRSHFEPETNNLSLKIQGTNKTANFNLVEQQADTCHWLGEYFGFPVEIRQNLNLGFPDDTVSPGATIISTATLEEVSSWYPDLDTENIRQRFRANIEIAGVPAFWEDCLFTTGNKTVRFHLGDVEFMGVNPCQRCIVVTRDQQTGEVYPKFQKIFIEQRKKTLPEWTERSRFNHFFRLAVNTKLAATEAEKTIMVGDKVVFKKNRLNRSETKNH